MTRHLLNSALVFAIALLPMVMKPVNATAATIIVDETFGGTSPNPLNGTTAETFDAAIVTAGGSSTWDASANFYADGSAVNGAFFSSAYLDLGSYVNDTKGLETGLFTLSATLAEGSGGSWSGFGFFENDALTNEDFTNTGNGQGFFIYRNGGELDGFGGPGSGNNVDGDVVSGIQLLTIVLDLTATTGYDGATNYGTITFYDGDADTGSSLGSYTYLADMDFAKIGLSLAQQSGVQYSTFTLEQVAPIPEPSTAILAGLGLAGLVHRRRRR